jgi:enamine deaminase RidA (YjgF/YER057c/UK114 family)
MAITRISPGTINSAAVTHGNVAYLSGFTAADKAGGVAGQTKQILDRIDKVLAEVGSDKTRILSAQIVLSDISKREEMNAVWRAWLDKAYLPARMTTGGALGSPDTLVEIMVTAAIDGR